ncbi:hypothetical protein Ef18B233LT_04840 [Escherichia fergusonii]|uniref:hypothetical protein n=1 Tax=Escherichia fergusonii TaxID=564 RepID=UPI002016FF7C|nr:hypothetical protein [Escherichia fergusonii]BED97611.1 hypothetical protein Ef30038_40350 [Escherichia fergusonii]BES07375.1 hypothetical protein Ef18B006LT_04700 [Escherichia fergusonii]BES15125.1 hypothetical protein Ef18B226LT_37040 [Escherichia fergusonii]BES16654.1 hypothetical protein Ef18B233LT_04840 [Escherichia fergusonii]BES21139.1 hypothetical protein Ef18B269LT_04830 [Escherichia fergusonii]
MKQAKFVQKTGFYGRIKSDNHKISGAGDAQKPAGDTLHLAFDLLLSKVSEDPRRGG